MILWLGTMLAASLAGGIIIGLLSKPRSLRSQLLAFLVILAVVMIDKSFPFSQGRGFWGMMLTGVLIVFTISIGETTGRAFLIARKRVKQMTENRIDVADLYPEKK